VGKSDIWTFDFNATSVSIKQCEEYDKLGRRIHQPWLSY